MTKKEKVIAAQAIVMLEELKATTEYDFIREEAERIIKELREAIES